MKPENHTPAVVNALQPTQGATDGGRPRPAAPRAPTAILSGFVIERPGPPAVYFSERLGRDVGSPYGGWVRELRDASLFDTEIEAGRYLERQLQYQAPDCRVRRLVLRS